MGAFDKLGTKIKNAWDAFNGSEKIVYRDLGYGSARNSAVHKPSPNSEKALVNAIYNRIAIDVSQLTFKHVRVDALGRYSEDVDSSLNECLTVEANIDQTSRAFIQDLVLTMFDEGYAGAFPTAWKSKDRNSESFDVKNLRSVKIVAWYPRHVRIDGYNECTGKHSQTTVPKSHIAIIQNPLYAVINEPNATLKRLIRKLSLLDAIDNQSSSGKLNMIIQLPYTLKTDAQKAQADKRRADIERQLVDSKYGIAYADGTEKIIQLNRPLENGLMDQIKYLQDILYSQLGLTASVMNGTASESEMLNYQTRTIEPLAAAIVDEMKRKFLTKTARSQGQSIMFFKQPFKLVTASGLVQLADVLTRNAIMSSNEVRQQIGLPPSDDPYADELVNKNLSQPANQQYAPESDEYTAEELQEPAPEPASLTVDDYVNLGKEFIGF